MKVRMKDIAETLNISISQVSRALSNRNGVAPRVRAAVLAMAKENSYQNISGKHNKKIAVIFKTINPARCIILNKYLRQAKRKNYTLMFMNIESAGFLKNYVFDSVYAFELSPEDINILKELYSGPILLLQQDIV